MIQFKNISKHYQLKGQTINALDQINLEIPEGSIFGIIGYSGAGKSTLIRLINLLERPTQGQVIINQKDFTAMDARTLRQERANIGMIFQHFNLLQTKTVAENIEMPLKLLGHSKAEREKRLAELLEFIDLKHKKDAYPDELSGGQKQRVGIARALDEINLTIPAGSIFGIIGYSGAGKSTLIRLINLLERPTHGQIIINQTDTTINFLTRNIQPNRIL